MRKLALSDEILLSVQQPARYIGGEVNMVKKDPAGKIRFPAVKKKRAGLFNSVPPNYS